MVFYFLFSLFFLLLKITPLISICLDQNISIHEYYLYFFLFFILFNFVLNLNNLIYEKKTDSDLIFKFFNSFFKNPNYFLNFILNNSKKIFLYLFSFKYRQNILFSKLIFKNLFNNFFLLWRPLFKKTSYFGFYRSNRSKWIK